MFALFFIIAFVTGLQNPMGVIIKSQFAASNLQSQLGNLANFIAYAFMGIPAGMMLQRMGYKKTALTAIAVGFAGVCVMWFAGRAGSYGIYLAGAFVSGFSMCMLNTVVNPMLKSLGSNEKRGNQLIQFGTTFNSLGATLTPILVGYLMGNEASARSIASVGRRPAENGGRCVGVTGSDPRGLTSRELADIRRRVMEGEKISF